MINSGEANPAWNPILCHWFDIFLCVFVCCAQKDIFHLFDDKKKFHRKSNKRWVLSLFFNCVVFYQLPFTAYSFISTQTVFLNILVGHSRIGKSLTKRLLIMLFQWSIAQTTFYMVKSSHIIIIINIIDISPAEYK